MLFVASALADRTSLLVPRSDDGKIATRPNEVSPNYNRWRSMVSGKNLLNLERDAQFSLPKSKNGQPIGLQAQSDTLRLLALKIEFEPEDPDNPTTTGNGNFDLRTFDEFVAQEGHEFDPAPHNSSYFSAHMEALNRYWKHVSDGRLYLRWDVYPQAENQAYRLPHPMAYYGDEGPWNTIEDRLGNFVIDAISLADTLAPEIDFGLYQSVFLFHAGADQQNNFAFIFDTPNDFWTGFLILAEPVQVDSGANEVGEALIMPETASQDNRVTVLNAVMAHEFGHQLGLIDIYNTANFLTVVGDFSLMDNNGLSTAVDFGGVFVSGVLPSYPDAWSRAYLGYSGVREITDESAADLAAAEQSYYINEVIKVPISEQEYFLLENRQVESDFEYTHYEPSIPYAILADSASGVILGPGWAFFADNDTVKVESGEYDRLLPGHGMLIWHVDEAVAYLSYTGWANNFMANTLQWDPYRRFLTVVEADGIRDFGDYYYAGYGSDDDFFKIGNNTAFTSSTNPDTRSNLGADSHISITDISASDTIMTCNIDIDWLQAGFPTMGFPNVGSNSGGLLAIDIGYDGLNELLIGRSRFLMAVNHDGSSTIDNSFGLLIESFDGDSVIYDFPIFAILDTAIAADLVAGDFDGDDSLEVACIDMANRLYIFEGHDFAPVDSLADLLASAMMPSAIAANALAAADIDGDGQDELIAGFDNAVDGFIGAITFVPPDSLAIDTLLQLVGTPLDMALTDSLVFVTIESNGELELLAGNLESGGIVPLQTLALPGQRLRSIACGDINRDNIVDAVITTSSGLCIFDGESQSLKSIPVENAGPAALGDVNSDGFPDLVLTGGSEFLIAHVFNYRGVLLDGFPVRLVQYPVNPEILNQPLIADLDADERPDILITLPQGGITCINYHGDRLGGFPLPTSVNIPVEPVIRDLDGDGDLELAVIDSSGFFAAWDLESAPANLDIPWPTAGGDYKRTGWLRPEFLKELQIASDFLPENSVYNYPNPAANQTAFRYYVDRPAEIEIKIYDLSGELIGQLSGSTSGQVPDEVSWDCSAIAPGVYFARFEANAAGLSKYKMIKVALIK